MMDTDIATAWAAWLGVVVAAIGLGFAGHQLREQRRLSRQEKAIELFQFCMSAFGKIVSARVEINATTDNQEARAKQNWIDYWDLLVVEFEFARANFLPDEVYVRWFGMMLHEYAADVRVGSIDAKTSWTEFSRKYVGLISPAFVELVDQAVQLPTEEAKAAVLHAVSTNRAAGIFGNLSA